MTFKQLSIGDKFRFNSEKTMPFSGMMRGPWVKTSARGYTHAESGGKYKVGSASAKVDLSNPAKRALPKGWMKASAVKITKKGGKVTVQIRKRA